MNLPVKIFGLILALLALFSINVRSQHIIKYEKNHEDSELSRVNFIDTIKNLTIKSFSPAEKCPYWNLAFPRLKGTLEYKTEKFYDFSDLDCLTGQDIPGLVVIEGGNSIKKPYWAETNHSAHLSSNKQWLLIFSVITITDYSQKENDGEFEGFANYLQIYNSKGNLYRTIISKDVEINEIHVTDDGSYLFYEYNIMQDFLKNFKNYPNGGFRIINLETMKIEMDVIDNDTSMIYLYPYVADDYICIFSETKDDYFDNNYQGSNTVTCFNLKKSEKYTAQIDPKFKEFWKIITITKEGVLFEGNALPERDTVLYRFDKDFQIEKIIK
jgi:hypothetical protein